MASTAPVPGIDRSDWKRPLLLLAAVTLLLMLYRLDGTPFRGLYDDVDRSLIARNMVDSGDWLVARYLYGPLYTKPPLMYWTAATLGVLTGRSDELPGNLASVLGMFPVVLAVFWAGRNLFGTRTGFWAGLVLATMHLFLAMSRQALLDTVMMGGFALAFGSLVHLGFSGTRRPTLWWLATALGLAVCFMTKGPVILPVFLLIWLPLLARVPSARPEPRQLLLALGLIAALTLPWPIALLNTAPQAAVVWKSEVFGRFGDGHQFHQWTQKPVWFYLPDLANTLPWVLLLPWGAAAAWRRRAEPRCQLLLWWALGGLVFFSLASATKRSYYLLPLYPGFALLVAAAWRDLAQQRRPGRALRLLPLLTLAAVPLLGVTFLALPFFYPEVPRTAFLAGGLLTTALGAAALLAAGRGRWAQALPLAAGATVFLHLAYFGHLVPPTNASMSGKPFFTEAAPLIGTEQVTLVDGNLALSAFYLHRIAYRYVPGRDFEAAMADNPGGLVITSPGTAHRLGGLEPILEREFTEPFGKKRGLGLYRHRPSQPDSPRP